MDLKTNYGRELYKFFCEKDDIYDLETFELRIKILFTLYQAQNKSERNPEEWYSPGTYTTMSSTDGIDYSLHNVDL